MSGRIAVGVSGTGSNLRALVAAAGRRELGGKVVLVFADRPCPGLDWAADQGIDTVLVPGGDDATLAETLAAVEPDAVVLAGDLKPVASCATCGDARAWRPRTAPAGHWYCETCEPSQRAQERTDIERRNHNLELTR